MADKYLDYAGVELLWGKIKSLLDKKMEKITPIDGSIVITNDNSIGVGISMSEGNLLYLENDGLYAARPDLAKLTFGAHEQYVYDGTEDVTVPVYDGEYHE